MICPKCGSQNPDAQKFCTGCGTELTVYYQQQQEYLRKHQQQQFQQSYQQDSPTMPLQEPVQSFDYAQVPDNAIVNGPLPGKGLGIAALILGILGLVFFCYWYVGIPLSLVGLILGAVAVAKAKKASRKNGMAIAGLVLSVIAIAIDAIIASTAGAFIFSMFNFY